MKRRGYLEFWDNWGIIERMTSGGAINRKLWPPASRGIKENKSDDKF